MADGLKGFRESSNLPFCSKVKVLRAGVGSCDVCTSANGKLPVEYSGAKGDLKEMGSGLMSRVNASGRRGAGDVNKLVQDARWSVCNKGDGTTLESRAAVDSVELLAAFKRAAEAFGCEKGLPGPLGASPNS